MHAIKMKMWTRLWVRSRNTSNNNEKKRVCFVQEWDSYYVFFLIGTVYKVYILSNDKKKYSYIWQIEKVLEEGILKNCWMTASVSNPKFLGDVIWLMIQRIMKMN